MLNFISLINNEFQEKISVLDRGFSYGDGFFETMSWRYLGGAVRPITKVEYWQRHYERIKAGCDLAFWQVFCYRDAVFKLAADW